METAALAIILRSLYLPPLGTREPFKLSNESAFCPFEIIHIEPSWYYPDLANEIIIVSLLNT
jgi:hypothetical protein